MISRWKTFIFEFMALIFNLMLLIFYSSQEKKRKENKIYSYINHSFFLKEYWLFQNIFFAALLMDTVFVITFIQLTILVSLFYFFCNWALKKDSQTSTSSLEKLKISITRLMKFLVFLQLSTLSLLQIAFVRVLFTNFSRVTEILQSIGLETNYEARNY